jgi:YD repeat-containing protein
MVLRIGGKLALASSVCAIATAAQASETTTYTFDALGRIVAVNSTGTVNNGIATSLGYDPAGNRAASTVAGARGSSPPPPPTTRSADTAARSATSTTLGRGAAV